MDYHLKISLAIEGVPKRFSLFLSPYLWGRVSCAKTLRISLPVKYCRQIREVVGKDF
jgi:hypothetical protein